MRKHSGYRKHRHMYVYMIALANLQSDHGFVIPFLDNRKALLVIFYFSKKTY